MPPSLPDSLPDTFTFREALAAGVTKYRLHALRAADVVEQVSHGLYRRVGARHLVDLDWLEIARRAPRATLCLGTALAHHGLSDANPPSIDVALPAKSWQPKVNAQVTWHLFARTTFDVGREVSQVDSTTSIGIYSAERSIVDAFRLSYREGQDVAYTALRRWLRRSGSSPAVLYQTARLFPQTTKSIGKALEILQYE
jgi:predicted transcriptional regulator of viral defense system